MKANPKIVSLSFLVCAALAWVFFRNLFDMLFDVLKVNVPVDWAISLPDILGIAVGIIFFIVMSRSNVISTFTDEVVVELTKVTWPERKETVLSTGVIIVMVSIVAAILLIFDIFWGAIVKVFF